MDNICFAARITVAVATFIVLHVLRNLHPLLNPNVGGSGCGRIAERRDTGDVLLAIEGKGLAPTGFLLAELVGHVVGLGVGLIAFNNISRGNDNNNNNETYGVR